MPDNDGEQMGGFTAPKSLNDMGPGPGMPPPGPRGPRMGVVFVDRSKLNGAGQPALAGRFVDSPFAERVTGHDVKTFQETYAETYADVKKNHKWLSKPWLRLLTTLSAIPRHLLRNSISSTTYNPKSVVQMENDYKNKL